MYYNTNGFSCHKLCRLSRKPQDLIVFIIVFDIQGGPVVGNSKKPILLDLLFVLTQLFL
jgi:hypothetical protein